MEKELCRNFQRGSCQYGARCRYLHSTPQQQQQQRAGGFGFGTRAGFQQQQNPNPYGFGVKSNSQLKPFSNQWTRNATTPSSRPADNQSQPANHTCTDPDACRRLIIEDFQNERPLWKLTCYGHWRYFPCDIAGDISYEELRAAAYDDARRGLSVQALVERERSLLNSKLVEFENLCRNPYVPRSNSNAGEVSSPSLVASAGPPVVSTFSQAASLSGALGARPSTPTVAAFGNLSPLAAAASSSSFSNSGMTPSFFGTNNLQSGSIGTNSSQFPTQMHVNSLPSSAQGSNTSAFGPVSNLFSTATVSPQVFNPASNQSSSSFAQTTSEIQLINSMHNGTQPGDTSVWLKEKWNPGEIPEEVPPDAFV
ncbi:hypothetical protein CDL15_Pgr010526 [Punica granatum]|uniref:C3H1-type domain-containing protein n=1 Tax=Punica granatum TaxID=22663 RepID=A0A218XXA9_PUNGR|nr:hypothetical protein CDL15_Pgr010526 [Punica granatum]PKI67790.1 hypothetical protein CRG98_011840 [Punica granatum]